MSKSIIVNKFGGGILTKEFIPLMKKRIEEQVKKGNQSIAVVSAMPKVTDEILNFLSSLKENYDGKLIESFAQNLLNRHKQIVKDIQISKEYEDEVFTQLENVMNKLEDDLKIDHKKTEGKVGAVTNALEDKVVSCGEKLSAIIMTYYFKSNNLNAKEFIAEEIPIITDDHFKNANIDYLVSAKNVKNKIKEKEEVVVIPGFTGITNNGEVTTLGRGGTDTTACFVGAALEAKRVILWKDVGGVLSADPKIVKTAKTIPFISYLEAEEAGKIIHDKAIQYVKMHKTEIEIASIANPKLTTKIGEIKKKEKGAKIVSIKKDLNLLLITDEIIKVNDLLLLVCDIFKKHKVEMILVSNTRYSLQIVAEKNDEIEKVYNEIKSKVEKIELIKASMVFLVGNFEAKDVNDFNSLLVKLGTDLQISAFYFENCKRIEAVIRTDNIEKVVNNLYKKFIKK